jgi:hypothetical protein
MMRAACAPTALALCLAALAALATAETLRQCTGYTTKDSCEDAEWEPVGAASPHLGPAGTSLPACGAHADGRETLARFASIGDFGLADAGCETGVARLLRQLESQFGAFDFVFTTGDNNYWDGRCETFESNVGQFFSRFSSLNETAPQPQCDDPTPANVEGVARRVASSGQRKPRGPARVGEPGVGRFFPTIGNHDYDVFRNYSFALPYLQFFPGLGRLANSGAFGQYYSARPVDAIEIFSLNSNWGTSWASEFEHELHAEQVTWLREALHTSNAPFKLVFFHHPPYTPARHDAPAAWMNLAFGRWGASAVFAGHEHSYERIERDVPYIINGLGGHPYLYDIHNCVTEAGSKVRYNAYHGAMLGLVSRAHDGEPEITMCFYSVQNGATLVDSFVLSTPNTERQRAAARANALSRWF